MSLNESQKTAINYVSGPCLILAGAGSGKTKVIINKIIHLIKQYNYNPSQIAAITFTNKAACEMKSRILNILPSKITNKIKISTFHSLGLEIIKSELKLLNIKSGFSIFDEQDQIAILQEIVLTKDRNFLYRIRQAISNWKNKLFNPDQAKKYSTSFQELKFSDYYKLYNTYLNSSNTLDFDDLIFLPTILFKNNKLSRERWNRKIKYLLVDEYQDTNFIQYELIKLLSMKSSNFTLVGDDDQSIYSWRGANVNNFLSLKRDYPCLHTIVMQRNYRSSGRILKVANKLIENNSHTFRKKLFSNFSYGSVIQIISASNEEDEANLILEKIYADKTTNKTQYKDYAILYRSNYQVKVFEKVLVKFKIPYYILANTSFFSRSEIKDLLAYLKLIVNPNDDISFLRIINKPLRGIGIITLTKLKKWGKERNKSLFYASLDVGLKFILPTYNFKKLQEFVCFIEKITYQIQLNPIKILKTLVIETKYEEWLSKNCVDFKLRTECVNNIKILFDWIIDELKQKINNSKTFTMKFLSEIISGFVIQNSLNENLKNESDYIQLMTLHASKGLEFLYVFMIGMEEGILPHHRSVTNNDIDEERRLTYVGITRTKKELFLSYARKRSKYGIIVNTTPSRFLLELPKSDLSWNKIKTLYVNQKK